MRTRLLILAIAACTNAPSKLDAVAKVAVPETLETKIDAIAADVLADTKVPSASIAVVADGKIIYIHAYGDARLEPKTAATPQMRYSIGSISKQFTAAALLMLVEANQLSLDDAVGKYIPGLTRGDDVTIRQLLTHTSGYRDYAPEDYIVPEWQKPISSAQIMERWARVPLDFEPGTQWQYSNTNFVIAGAIFEKVAGRPMYDVLQERVFAKLGMTSVTNSDLAALTKADAQGYFRRANGPAHEAPHEGPGWMYAAGELAMTAEDLAKWDISVMNQSILAKSSYAAMEAEQHLANSIGTHYGLGIGVAMEGPRRSLGHGGEVSGFVAQNSVLPDDGIAVVVLTNQDASAAAGKIAGRIKDAVLQTKGRQRDRRRARQGAARRPREGHAGSLAAHRRVQRVLHARGDRRVQGGDRSGRADR